MKYLLIAIILFTSCALLPTEEVPQDIPISFDTMAEAWLWVATNIEYQIDDYDIWQSPEETYSLRTGDCEDFALLLAYFLNEMGYAAYFTIFYTGEGFSRHAIVSVPVDDGFCYLEPQMYGHFYFYLEEQAGTSSIPYERAIWLISNGVRWNEIERVE